MRSLRTDPAADRDRGIDTWRAAAVLRVIVYHTLGWAWLTIVFPAMGLMFALAGSLMARSLDRRGTRVVTDRLRRLLPPVWIFGICALAVMISTGWRTRPDTALGWGELLWWIIPVRTPPAGGPQWAWAFTSMLWYLVAYLWFVALSPALLVIFRRWPWPALGLSLLLPIALHLHVVTVGGYLIEPLTNICTYACCWLLGFAHHDRLLRRVPWRRFAIAVTGLAVAGGAWLWYFGSSQGDFDLNHVPVAKSLWPAAFVAVVLRFDLPIGVLRRLKWLRWPVDAINARAVTVYLWHFLMVVAAQAVLGGPQQPFSPKWSALMLATVCSLTALVTVAVGWVEDLAARRPVRLIPPRRPVRLIPPRRPGVAPSVSPARARGGWSRGARGSGRFPCPRPRGSVNSRDQLARGFEPGFVAVIRVAAAPGAWPRALHRHGRWGRANIEFCKSPSPPSWSEIDKCEWAEGDNRLACTPPRGEEACLSWV